MSDMVNVNFKLDAETKRGMEQACKDNFFFHSHAAKQDTEISARAMPTGTLTMPLPPEDGNV